MISQKMQHSTMLFHVIKGCALLHVRAWGKIKSNRSNDIFENPIKLLNLFQFQCFSAHSFYVS